MTGRHATSITTVRSIPGAPKFSKSSENIACVVQDYVPENIGLTGEKTSRSFREDYPRPAVPSRLLYQLNHSLVKVKPNASIWRRFECIRQRVANPRRDRAGAFCNDGC